ncbi:LacI family DNA-binding transcriptional regulator [Nocardia fluminea]|uniref:LacI family DNA-binding transcriptional regulator n=1 Tax=Nocardia fluminea TaxID=134984 RepID=UPI0033F08353
MVTKSEDVARAAGVSRGTVSQILNGHGQRFSVATQERVRRLAVELDYRPSIAGRALAMGASDIVVLLVPFTAINAHLQSVLERATDDLATHGLTLVLRLATQSAASVEQLVADLRPRAVLSLVPFTAAERAALDRHDIVAIDPAQVDDGVDRRIGRIQAEHLVGKGYRRLAYVHLDDERCRIWGKQREPAVAEVCAENGLPAPMVLGPRMHPDDVAATVDALPDETGVACFNDDIAIALLHAAKLRGRCVPGGLGLVGMDAIPLAATTHPRLTTVTIDERNAALRLADLVLGKLGIAAPATAPDIAAGPRLVEGESA